MIISGYFQKRLGISVAVMLAVMAMPLQADDEFAQKATWAPPTAAEVRSELTELLASRKLKPDQSRRIDALWNSVDDTTSPADLHRLTVASLALIDNEVEELVAFCGSRSAPVTLPTFPILESTDQPEFLRNNLRLLFGEWLAQHRYYDESLAQLDGLEPEDVVDPAALLFYQSICQHRMPDKQKCLPLTARLLENEKLIPRRYAALAQLVQADLKPLETDSLDEISRLMDEVQRRLDLNRAGKRVRDQEDEVVKKLDKLIKKIEEQQQQSSAQSMALAPSNPAQDSTPMGGKGAGKVDPKSTGTQSGWGNLPPKERREALQQIGKDLPAHYREVIEEYFRKLAREGDSSG